MSQPDYVFGTKAPHFFISASWEEYLSLAQRHEDFARSAKRPLGRRAPVPKGWPRLPSVEGEEL